MDNRASNYSLPSTVQVVVNGVSLGNFTNSNNTNNVTNWQQFTTAFTAVAGNNTVQFVNATPVSDFMAGLDDVSLDLAHKRPFRSRRRSALWSRVSRWPPWCAAGPPASLEQDNGPSGGGVGSVATFGWRSALHSSDMVASRPPSLPVLNLK